MLRCFICPLATKQTLRRNCAIFFVLCLIYVYSRQSWLTDAAIESQLAALTNISLARNRPLNSFVVGAPGKNTSAVVAKEKKKAVYASSKEVVHLSRDKKLPLSNWSTQDNGKSKVKRESGVPQSPKNSVELNSQKKAT